MHADDVMCMIRFFDYRSRCPFFCAGATDAAPIMPSFRQQRPGARSLHQGMEMAAGAFTVLPYLMPADVNGGVFMLVVLVFVFLLSFRACL